MNAAVFQDARESGRLTLSNVGIAELDILDQAVIDIISEIGTLLCIPSRAVLFQTAFCRALPTLEPNPPIHMPPASAYMLRGVAAART